MIKVEGHIPTLFIINRPSGDVFRIYMYTEPSGILLQTYPPHAKEAYIIPPLFYRSRSGMSFDATFEYSPLERKLKQFLKRAKKYTQITREDLEKLRALLS